MTSAAARKSAALVPVVSGSGGVGKSAVSLAASRLASKAGLKTALFETDLQFGDLGFWLGLDEAADTLGEGLDARPIALGGGLDLFKAPCFPEVAEGVADAVCSLLMRERNNYDLVIADTGALWSGLTAELVLNGNVVVIMADERPSSMAAAVRADELCARIGVPNAKRAFALNRYSGKSRQLVREFERNVGSDRIYRIPDARGAVDKALCAGDLDILADTATPFAHALDAMLADLLPRAGCSYEKAVAVHKGRWFS